MFALLFLGWFLLIAPLHDPDSLNTPVLSAADLLEHGLQQRAFICEQLLHYQEC